MFESVGKEWGMFGDLDASIGMAKVDRVDQNYPERTVGLTAKQLDNVGADYGDLQIKLETGLAGEEGRIEVGYMNAYGSSAPSQNDGIIISPDISEEYDLEAGDSFALVRTSTETGELLHEVRNHSGEFGQNWDYQGTPQSVVPVFVDRNEGSARIGLSAMQMRNLDAPAGSVLQVSYDGEQEKAEVYNTAGIRAVGGKGVRVSESLAEETGIEQGEEFSIEHVLSKSRDNQPKNPEDVSEMLDENNRRGQS